MLQDQAYPSRSRTRYTPIREAFRSIVDKILRAKKLGYGFDAAKEVYTNMMDAGIVDPTKVSRSALQNAASIASVVLTTEALVADKKEEKPAAPAAPDMGGMY